jgi:hypothetical protein
MTTPTNRLDGSMTMTDEQMYALKKFDEWARDKGMPEYSALLSASKPAAPAQSNEALREAYERGWDDCNIVGLAAAKAAKAAQSKKKPHPLCAQIKRAQAEMAAWSPEKRASVRLEGNDPLLSQCDLPKTEVSMTSKQALAEIGRCIADPMWAEHAEVPKRLLKRWHKAFNSGEKEAQTAQSWDPVKPHSKLVTFDEFVQYGKDHGANVVNGMPWSFVFYGHAVTHETDDLYMIGTPSIAFRLGELLVVSSCGKCVLMTVLQPPAPQPASGVDHD